MWDAIAAIAGDALGAFFGKGNDYYEGDKFYFMNTKPLAIALVIAVGLIGGAIVFSSVAKLGSRAQGGGG